MSGTTEGSSGRKTGISGSTGVPLGGRLDIVVYGVLQVLHAAWRDLLVKVDGVLVLTEFLLLLSEEVLLQ